MTKPITSPRKQMQGFGKTRRRDVRGPSSDTPGQNSLVRAVPALRRLVRSPAFRRLLLQGPAVGKTPGRSEFLLAPMEAGANMSPHSTGLHPPINSLKDWFTNAGLPTKHFGS